MYLFENSKPFFNGSFVSFHPDCGQKPPPSMRVINGSVTFANEYPWMAQMAVKGYGPHYCGGTVINDEYILTAAHCVYGMCVIASLL